MVDYTFIRKDIIARTTIIEGVVETVAPLRIGGGKENFDPASIARDPILKDSNERPYIPGSSWKGVFRSTGERILRGRKIEVCSGIGKDYCLEKNRVEKEFQNSMERDISRALEIFWNYTCLNCKVFGTMSVIGSVKFLDSIPINYRISTRTMVAISRTEGAAARRALVQVEYVEPNSKFTFKLIGTNLPNYVIGYLVTIMNYIHDGLTQIGGHKSRGFGFVKFDTLSFKDTGANKIGDEDISVNVSKIENVKGDEFFTKMKPFMEAFEHVQIPYPKK